MASVRVSPENITPEAMRAESQYLVEMAAKFQAELDRLKRPEVLNVCGATYLATAEKIELIKQAPTEKIPKVEAFQTFTLDGLIEFIQKDVDGFFKQENEKHIVRVTNPVRVQVMSQTMGPYLERMVVAECWACVPNISFDTYMDTENFQIMVQTCFEDTENRAKVLMLAGNLKKEQDITTSDDGVSQRVTVNAGVATVAGVTVKNPVELVPFRTFREVEQPASPFVLRFDDNARAALFDGDGKAWMLEAVNRVAEYLKNNLAGYNVVVIA